MQPTMTHQPQQGGVLVNKRQPPLKQQRQSQRPQTAQGNVPKVKPSIHPVRYRLGETEEQRVFFFYFPI